MTTASQVSSVIESEQAQSSDRKLSGITPIKICFVCTGNTCRSPMAAALLNHFGKGMYACSSAGLTAGKGLPITPHSATALLEFGVESTKDNNYLHHSSRQISEEIFENCDRIIGVSLGHARLLMQYFPQYADKIGNLSRAISDPFGGSLEDYKACLSDIYAAIKEDFILPEE